MTGNRRPNYPLIWSQVLSPHEIRAWVVERRRPECLRADFRCPAVYRFVFPEFRDEHGSHRECYIGEAGVLADRIAQYFCIGQEKLAPSGTLTMESEWKVRGAVQICRGECRLEQLMIQGHISVCGVKIAQADLEDQFVRRLIENWAILYSEQFDHLVALNRVVQFGTYQTTKDFRRAGLHARTLRDSDCHSGGR